MTIQSRQAIAAECLDVASYTGSNHKTPMAPMTVSEITVRLRDLVSRSRRDYCGAGHQVDAPREAILSYIGGVEQSSSPKTAQTVLDGARPLLRSLAEALS